MLHKTVHRILGVLLGTQERWHKKEACHCGVQLGICDAAFPDHRTANPSFESTEGEILKVTDFSTTSTSLVSGKTLQFFPVGNCPDKTSKQQPILHSPPGHGLL